MEPFSFNSKEVLVIAYLLYVKTILESTKAIAMIPRYEEVVSFPVCRFKKLKFVSSVSCPGDLSDLRSGFESKHIYE